MTSPNGITKLPPIAFPQVVIGNEILTLKVSLLAGFLLDSWGVQTDQLGALLQKEGPGRFSLMFKLFGALVAHNYVENHLAYPSPEEWALKIPQEQVGEIFAKINEAMVKAKPAAVPAMAPAEVATPIPQ